MHIPKCILTIAGSDSGAGAGIQADLKTITMLGGYALTAITALTAQNGLGVTAIHPATSDFMSAQLDAVLTGFTVEAAKTGMLFDENIINIVAEKLKERKFPLVVDPVCVSQSGHRLLKDEALDALQAKILPLADLLTPNRPEAELLASMSINSEEDIAKAAEKLHNMGSKAVLIKGGHFDSAGDVLIDWLCLPNAKPLAMPQKYVETKHNHGTGCTLSAAITTYLGTGEDLESAIKQAQAYLNLCLTHGYAPGLGTGPPNHAIPYYLA